MNFIGQAIASAVRELLETKHLYQSVEISEKSFDNFIQNSIEAYKQEIARGEPGISSGGPAAIAKVFGDQLRDRKISILNSPWDFDAETYSPIGRGAQPARISENFPSITSPSVRVSCGSKKCKGSVQPHNSGYIGAHPEIDSYTLNRHPSIVQIFSFAYQCQNCKEEPLVFLVKRDSLKLTLVGRSQFPEVSVPDFIPKDQRIFYRRAIIAEQTDFTLAAALYLRTLIEQRFYQVIPKADIEAIKGNPTGDELADLYAKTLPKSFPSDFPSLKKAYSDLSEVLHRGKEDAEVSGTFIKVRICVDKHFDALRVFDSISTK
ncbi:MAG: hypothetical protein ABSF60_08090 [Verrucomicrobiota bacterium]